MNLWSHTHIHTDNFPAARSVEKYDFRARLLRTRSEKQKLFNGTLEEYTPETKNLIFMSFVLMILSISLLSMEVWKHTGKVYGPLS